MRLTLLAAACIAAPCAARAQAQPGAEQITVIAPTPVPGAGVDAKDIPEAVRILGAQDIDRTGLPSLTGAMLEDIPSVGINDTSGNPFQPDILFRGFTASPVTGTGQGLAVYVNGARFNDPFGDTVNWDLIPPIAIKSVSVEAANPIFGLNALGGSVNVQMKTGFNTQGADLTTYGGAFNRAASIAEYGVRSGDVALYAAGDITHDGGYRQTQASDVRRLYTDLGWRSDAAELHLNVTAADDALGNPGAAPVQAIDADPTAIFTAPNTVINQYVAVNLNGHYALSDSTALQGIGYYQTLTQRIVNGATADVAPCGGGALCNDDGTLVIARGGGAVPDFLHGRTYSALVTEGLDAHAYGGSLQVTNDTLLFHLRSRLTAGVSLDGSDSIFDAQTQLGGYNPLNGFFVPPGVTQDQPAEGVQPVTVVTTTRIAGLFLSDVLTLTRAVNLTIDGRFNTAEIDLHDKLGSALTGQHAYSRFNPGIGLTYDAAPGAQLYARYSEANRAPTPTELSCSTAANPCSLLNFFIGDPDLKQVVARTIEAGVRGHTTGAGGLRLSWDADLFRTADQDDLIFQTALNNPNLAFYTNAGRTRRQGIEINLHLDTARMHAVFGYSFTDATYRTPLTLGTASNPFADANGNEHVMPGDRLPGIPQHRATAVLDYKITDRLTLGASATLTSAQYRFGDEANLGKPVGGVLLLNLDGSYRVTDAITLFALIDNVTDRRYDTYGSFGPVGAVPWPTVPGGVTDPRTGSPGAPLSAFGGVRIAFR